MIKFAKFPHFYRLAQVLHIENLPGSVIRVPGNTEGPSILVWDLIRIRPAPLLDKQGGGSGGR